MKSNNAIEVRNMSKSFKLQFDKAQTIKERLLRGKGKSEYQEVLKDININIKKGETVALIGTNGSGKSTLLKLMTKIIYPTIGDIETSGKLTSLLELGAGFHPDFTGRENIYFNASVFGLTRKEINKRLEDIIEFSELGMFIDKPIRTYSSGMYMRLAFSIAINVDADILLIDEILAVGDQHFQEKCFNKLKELSKSDKTIVIVSHSLNVIEKLCDRAIWISEGYFRLDGDPRYVIGEYLKEVSEKNEKEEAALKEIGQFQYKGIINIDTPQNFQKVEPRTQLVIAGWCVSNSNNERLRITVDDFVTEDIARIPREDVYDLYSEEYVNYLEKEVIGWQTAIIVDPKLEGEVPIKVELFNEEELIVDKEVIVIVKQVNSDV